MKSIQNTSLIIVLAFFGVQPLIAQNATEQAFQDKIAEKQVPGAQLGSLICQNADGKMVLCSGDLEETILGVTTNVPYITLNKPATPNANKAIFNANVSAVSGVITRGDFLTAGNNGQLVKCNDSHLAYAIALDDANGTQTIRVKVLK